jgi:hypothetical protein
LHSVREIEKFRRRSLFPETPSLKKRAIVPKNFEEMGKKPCATEGCPNLHTTPRHSMQKRGNQNKTMSLCIKFTG